MNNLELAKSIKRSLASFSWIDASKITNFEQEPESQEYSACKFEYEQKKIFFRKAKITPTKDGAFVTFWKRASISKKIEPMHQNDYFDELWIIVEENKKQGLIVLSKQTLQDQKILHTPAQQGKLAFRVYPPWATNLNTQASKTQSWQIKCFFTEDD